jgi:hypothetical protein
MKRSAGADAPLGGEGRVLHLALRQGPSHRLPVRPRQEGHIRRRCLINPDGEEEGIKM